jgi:hypothetical protein
MMALMADVRARGETSPFIQHAVGGDRRAPGDALGADKSAASKRYARALIRLKDVLASLPSGLSEG